jgi:hypothetical protein
MNEITEKNIKYGLTFRESGAETSSDCLSGEVCLLCNGTEKNYKPGPDVNFICGTCIQLLLRAGQEDLKRAYEKALAKGYPRKASAIETFLKPEDMDGKRPGKKRPERKSPSKSIGRSSNRKRVTRLIRA